MHKIIPHLWFDKKEQVHEAAKLYISLFKDSKIDNITSITNTPSGDCDIINFTLAGQKFMSISAGPYFKFNPAVSMFVVFDNEKEIEEVWNKLIDGGKALMPFNTYPWAKKYGWVEDKWGLTWQLSMSEHHKLEQKITPLLMFTKDKSGKTKEALEYYTQVFPNSKIDMVATYEKGEGDTEGFIKHSRFSLNGNNFMAMDSSGPHDFIFNEAISFIVKCDSQEEIDHYWSKLSAVPESEQCGWCKDKYDVSWQIVPKAMDAMMASGDKEKIGRVTQAFLKMKKFDIATLEKAAEGNNIK
jgi:predicted 3-demethylubiquinone-9 3-methyltransferase (glyoxalase superfamily)